MVSGTKTGGEAPRYDEAKTLALGGRMLESEDSKEFERYYADELWGIPTD
jgi:hypothetical protein